MNTFLYWISYRVQLAGILCALNISFADAQEPGSEFLHPDCQTISDDTRDNWSIAIRHPGAFCLGHELKQSWPLIRLPHQAVPMSPLISVFSSDVSLQLMNYKLTARTPIGQGVLVEDTSIAPRHSIKIAGGSISTSSQPTIFMVHSWNDANKRFGRGRYAIALSNGNLLQYRPTEFILENLTLEADKHVIIMQGMRNIIRHCKIVGGNGTVNLYGPHLTFEDNEIILHAKAKTSDDDEAPVALYLEDATDSVIRNNHIVIQGRSADSEAIVLKNSSNVTLEGNTVSGASSLYRLLDDHSSVEVTNNSLTQWR